MRDDVRNESIIDHIEHRLREDIINGRLLPGQQLVEVDLAQAYDVSRNTIREVLHLLVRDGLATSIRFRGVFVRIFCERDLHDIYTARRTIQLQAIRSGSAYTRTLLEEIAEIIDRAKLSVANQQWQDVGTLSLAFHQALVRVLDSAMIDEFFLNICAQLRLIFTIGPDERIVQKPMWVQWEEQIHNYIVDGDYAEAEAALDAYLTESQRALSKIVRHYEPTRLLRLRLPLDDVVLRSR